MKNIKPIILAITLSGCAQNYTFTPAPQSYRPINQEKTIQITAKLDQTLKISNGWTNHLTIYFDGQTQIEGNLDKNVNGDIQGKPYQNKNTSASCSTRHIAQNIGETRCTVFIDNERITTLTM